MAVARSAPSASTASDAGEYTTSSCVVASLYPALIDKGLSCRRETARRSLSVEMVSTAAFENACSRCITLTADTVLRRTCERQTDRQTHSYHRRVGTGSPDHNNNLGRVRSGRGSDMPIRSFDCLS